MGMLMGETASIATNLSLHLVILCQPSVQPLLHGIPLNRSYVSNINKDGTERQVDIPCRATPLYHHYPSQA